MTTSPTTWITLALALPMMVAGFKWLMNTFERDNRRNRWWWAGVAGCAALAAATPLLRLLGRWLPGLLGFALGLAVVALICGAVVRVVYRLDNRRALALGAGIPIAWALAVMVAWLGQATGLTLMYSSPILTSAAMLLGGIALIAVHRRNLRFTRQLYQLTSWLGG